jgi:hypothetical protein
MSSHIRTSSREIQIFFMIIKVIFCICRKTIIYLYSHIKHTSLVLVQWLPLTEIIDIKKITFIECPVIFLSILIIIRCIKSNCFI